MRRIVTFDARPGMVLHAPLTLVDGGRSFAAGDVLTEADLTLLHDAPGIEIDVEDALTAYARERPMFPAAVEGATLQALNTLIMLHPGLDQPVAFHALEPLLRTIAAMVEAAYASPQGTMELTGPDSLQGHDYVHPVRAMEVAIVIARALQMPRIEATAVATGAALMNIGYAALRRSLLDEPRGLEEHEWRHQVEKHPEYSVRILGEGGLTDEVMRAIADHHERWDGSGYPRGVAAADIPRSARIIAVADTYVSLRSRRAYRSSLPHEEAIALLADGAGAAFDPDVVRVFVDAAATLVAPLERATATSPSATASQQEDTAARADARTQPLREESNSGAIARKAEPPPDDASTRSPACRRPLRSRNGARATSTEETTAMNPSPRTAIAATARIPGQAPGRISRTRALPRARAAAPSLWSARFYLQTRI